MTELKKVRKFKNELIKNLPFFPNDKETLKELEAQTISNIMIHYLQDEPHAKT